MVDPIDRFSAHFMIQKLFVGEAVEVDATHNAEPAENSDNQDEDLSSDEEDEEDIGKENAHEDTQKHSKKLPSANELRMINETRTLYKSNIFRAQACFFLMWLCVCLMFRIL